MEQELVETRCFLSTPVAHDCDHRDDIKATFAVILMRALVGPGLLQGVESAPRANKAVISRSWTRLHDPEQGSSVDILQWEVDQMCFRINTNRVRMGNRQRAFGY